VLEEMKHVLSSLLEVCGVGEGGKRNFFLEEVHLEHITFLHGVWKVAAIAAIVFERGTNVPANFAVLTKRGSVFGSNMGDANKHDNTNLPIILAGGGLKHGRHHAFKADNNLPLSNLFVSMLQHMGAEVDAFGSSTGTLGGLA
jgi:hypothetical protein